MGKRYHYFIMFKCVMAFCCGWQNENNVLANETRTESNTPSTTIARCTRAHCLSKCFRLLQTTKLSFDSGVRVAVRCIECSRSQFTCENGSMLFRGAAYRRPVSVRQTQNKNKWNAFDGMTYLPPLWRRLNGERTDMRKPMTMPLESRKFKLRCCWKAPRREPHCFAVCAPLNVSPFLFAWRVRVVLASTAHSTN